MKNKMKIKIKDTASDTQRNHLLQFPDKMKLLAGFVMEKSSLTFPISKFVCKNKFNYSHLSLPTLIKCEMYVIYKLKSRTFQIAFTFSGVNARILRKFILFNCLVISKVFRNVFKIKYIHCFYILHK